MDEGPEVGSHLVVGGPENGCLSPTENVGGRGQDFWLLIVDYLVCPPGA